LAVGIVTETDSDAETLGAGAAVPSRLQATVVKTNTRGRNLAVRIDQDPCCSRSDMGA
jgi:predicted lipoprotein